MVRNDFGKGTVLPLLINIRGIHPPTFMTQPFPSPSPPLLYHPFSSPTLPSITYFSLPSLPPLPFFLVLSPLSSLRSRLLKSS